MVQSPGIGIAFFAGFLSFISPCVLPLIPAYIGYLAGRATTQFSSELTVAGSPGTAVIAQTSVQKNRLGVMLHGIFFVAGFTIFFVGFGLITNAGFQAIQASYDIKSFLYTFGGLLVIFFGLHVMGVTGWLLRILITKVRWQYMGRAGTTVQHGLERIQGVLYSDTRRQINPRNPYGYAGSSLMGIVFAAGWSPCIGPIYGLILTMAATRGSSNEAGVLLLAYSLGLGMPFLMTAAALDRMRGLLKRLQRQMRLIEVVSGVFLIAMGYLLFTNQMALIAQFSTNVGLDLGNIEVQLETCVVDGWMRGKIPLSEVGACLAPTPAPTASDSSSSSAPVTPGLLLVLPDGRGLYAR